MTRLSAALLTCAISLHAGAALAQAWPSRPVTLIVPQAPGGANDRAARFVAEKLEQAWHQSVIVDFKPGGGVVVGTQYVARSSPDGYTPGMVKLVVQKRKARMGRNPATGEAIKIPAKTVVKARIAKQLKDAVLPRK